MISKPTCEFWDCKPHAVPKLRVGFFARSAQFKHLVSGWMCRHEVAEIVFIQKVVVIVGIGVSRSEGAVLILVHALLKGLTFGLVLF